MSEPSAHYEPAPHLPEFSIEEIGHHTGEGGCMECGYPMYVGDKTLYTDAGDQFCSKACMVKAYEEEDPS